MDKYLLEILKESNTIIIPGLGALTITNTETGETMFMPYLQHDDGKLAEFIAKKDGIDESDAKIMVAKYVREIQAELGKGESYVMFELGTFIKGSDGDVEYAHWTKGSPEKVAKTPVAEDTAPAKEKIIVSEIEAIDEVPKVEPTPKVTAKPDVIEITPEEIPVKNAIDSAIKKAEKAEKEPIKKVVEKAAPVVDKKIIPEVKSESIIEKAVAATTAAAAPIVEKVVAPKAEMKKAVEKGSEKVEAASESDPFIRAKEPKKKKKRGAGFWILMVLLAGLIGGGTYFAMNYDELKQHVPFLADAKPTMEKTDAKEKMEEMLNGDEETENDAEEGTSDTESEETSEEGMTEEAPIETPVVETPVATVSNSGGAYHIVSGAFSSAANANRLMETFKSQGLPAKVIQNNGLNVVCMQSYGTSAAASADLSKMKAIAPSAWVLHKP